MPELPEVETFRRFLEKKVKGKKINKINLFFPKLIKKPYNYKKFPNFLVGLSIDEIKRKGKYLLFFLQKYVLIVHLRMEGKFIFENVENKNQLHCSMEFIFEDNKRLYYCDSRKFGTFELELEKHYLENKGLKKLGLEPFDSKLTVSYLQKNWSKRTILIKTALLEQTVIAGIGNIYACEILFLSNISPFQKINTLNEKQLQKIITNLQKIMKKAIQLGGTTTKTFKVNERKGLFFKELKVYAKKNQKCFFCFDKILWIKINNRGTFYCPSCQKKD